MQHEVYVPFAVAAVRSALAEPERVARCVPGLQLDAPEVGDTVAGRLRVRIGGSTITYRGTLTMSGRGDGLVVEGKGAEARGGGSAEFALTVTTRPAPDGAGTTLLCSGTVRGEGRIAAYEERQSTGAGRRLLERCAAALAESIAADASGGATASTVGEPSEGPAGAGAADGVSGLTTSPRDASELAEEDTTPVTEPEESPLDAGIGGPDGNERAIPGIPAPESVEAESSELVPEAESAGAEERAESESGGLYEAEVPASSLDPLRDEVPPKPAAEAAHARRSMIGRSAEEVDHAPPRGRYAPVPAPEQTSPAAALRWAAPVVAAAVASAVVLNRLLRRRR